MSPSMNLNHNHQTLTLSIPHHNNHRQPTTTTTATTTSTFSIRLFYVRISPCAATSIPTHLTLRHLPTSSLSINSTPVPTSSPSTTITTTLRRDRLDSTSSEVTYVSTDTLSISNTLHFEVYDDAALLLCGSLDKLSSEWSMSCHPGPCNGSGSSFFQPKMGISSPSLEVYVAGRWNDLPVIMTKVVNISPRRKPPKYRTLDAIPENGGDDVDKDHTNDNINSDLALVPNGFIRHRKFQLSGDEDEYEYEYEADGKMAHSYYSDECYVDEDGQLSWFNAGVRVGVGIGLGMCLGLGIGVGLLMRSYQTTTRNFRRRFL